MQEVTLFSFLLKYKKVKNNEKFCNVDNEEDSFIVDTLANGDLKSATSERIYKGFVKKFNNELFYAPYDRDYLFHQPSAPAGGYGANHGERGKIRAGHAGSQ